MLRILSSSEVIYLELEVWVYPTLGAEKFSKIKKFQLKLGMGPILYPAGYPLAGYPVSGGKLTG